MGMSVGSVTVDQTDGTWVGSGASLALMNVIQPLLVAQLPAGYSTAVLVGISNGAAVIAEGAAALVTYIQTNGQLVIPANAFGSGIPASTTTLSSAIS
jgi:hypothetical protein